MYIMFIYLSTYWKSLLGYKGESLLGPFDHLNLLTFELCKQSLENVNI